MTYAAEEVHLVAFELHPSPATNAEPSTGEVTG
jgi:hypothetical protein